MYISFVALPLKKYAFFASLDEINDIFIPKIKISSIHPTGTSIIYFTFVLNFTIIVCFHLAKEARVGCFALILFMRLCCCLYSMSFSFLHLVCDLCWSFMFSFYMCRNKNVTQKVIGLGFLKRYVLSN